MAVRPKEGRYYKDGFGSVGGPASYRGCGVGPWAISFPDGVRQYTAEGKYNLGTSWNYDLVSECDAEGNPIKDEAMTAAAQLVMKEGSYYEDGRGRTRGPMFRRSVSCSFPWVVKDDFGATSFTNIGAAKGDDDCRGLSLIREVPAPSAPEAPKPETVTITQEMVDRAILDAVKAGDASRAVEIHDAWDDLRRVMQQTDDGWIPWEGGEEPIAKEDRPKVRVKLRCGEVIGPSEGNFYIWRHSNGPSDVIAYRIME